MQPQTRPLILACPSWLAALMVAALLATSLGCETNPRLRAQAGRAQEASQFEEANTLLTRAIERDATDWRAHLMLGDVLMQQSRFVKAQLAYENAMATR